MKRTGTLRRIRWLPAVLFCLLVAATLMAQGVSQSSSITVVVNAKNPANDITLAHLQKILLGEQHTWNNKTPIVLIMRAPGSRERDLVLRVVVHMTEAEYKQHWLASIFRGEATSEPFTAPSRGLATEVAADKPGSITFVEGSEVRADRLRENLKLLKVNGFNPDDPMYPLR